MDIVFAVLICICMVCIWGALILARTKKKGKISAGRLVSSAGMTVILIALLLNAFELVSRPVYIAVCTAGILAEAASVIISLKQNEF